MNNIQNLPPAGIPVNPEQVVLEMPHSGPSVEISRQEVQAHLNQLPVYNPPASNIGQGGDGPRLWHSGGPVNQVGASVVIANNQPAQRQSGHRDHACEEFKSDCHDYCCCVETEDKAIQRARCLTFNGSCVGLSVCTLGCWGMVYCCVAFCNCLCTKQQNVNVCELSSFQHGCCPQ